MKNILKCPNCGQSLFKSDNSYKCPSGHSFDISRKGALNLLLPNQTHTDNSGDNKEMIQARVNFLSTGKYDILKNEVISIIQKYMPHEFVFGDMACGEGYYTNLIHEYFVKSNFDISSYGIDLSKSGINECLIKQRKMGLSDIQYVIGNLFYLPFMDNSFDVLLNSFAKIEEGEFYRVLKKGGIYIRVLPDTNHLYGLKKALYDVVHLNLEKDEEIRGFRLLEIRKISDIISLDNTEIRNLFKMTPYYYKTSYKAMEKLFAYENLETEIAFKFLIYIKEGD